MAKAGRPPHKRPHEIKLQLPKDPQLYRAKRLYWAMLEMEKKMSKDITSVRMADYDNIVKSYIECVEGLAKKGITYGTHFKPRVDAKGSVKGSTEQAGTAEAGGNGSSGLGVGIPAANPIT